MAKKSEARSKIVLLMPNINESHLKNAYILNFLYYLQTIQNLNTQGHLSAFLFSVQKKNVLMKLQELVVTLCAH